MLVKLLPAMIAGLMLLLLSGVWLFGAEYLLPSIDVVAPSPDEPDRSAVEFLALQLTATDQLLNFVTAIGLGLVVVVGYVIKPDSDKQIRYGADDVAALAIFMIAIFLAMYLAFGTRMKALEFVAFKYPSFAILRDSISSQAIATAVAAVSACYLAAKLPTASRESVLEAPDAGAVTSGPQTSEVSPAQPTMAPPTPAPVAVVSATPSPKRTPRKADSK